MLPDTNTAVQSATRMIIKDILFFAANLSFGWRFLGRRRKEKFLTALSTVLNSPHTPINICCWTIMQYVAPQRLMEKILKRNNNTDIAFHFLQTAILVESRSKKKAKKNYFSSSQKDMLLSVVLACENENLRYAMVKTLLYCAAGLNYEQQKEIFDIFAKSLGKFGSASELLEAYENFTGLAPDLRGSLKKAIVDIMNTVELSLVEDEGGETDGESKPDSPLN
ncbi:MAG: hypothetical protein V1661_00770 [bacterium]